jgi:hypothetical protein
MNNNGNILINQIISDNSSFKFKELIPSYDKNGNEQCLTITPDGSVYWKSVDSSYNNIVNNKFENTDIYYDNTNERVGIGRFPLYNYKIDIKTPKDSLLTALHIGDGSFGFSLGNGTSKGFVPEIIGVGSDENDAGLYFVGIASNDVSSEIPIILIDGRNSYGDKITNRPILGITSGDYNEYLVSVDSTGNLSVQTDIVINNKSLLNIIKDLQLQINELKTKIT